MANKTITYCKDVLQGKSGPISPPNTFQKAFYAIVGSLSPPLITFIVLLICSFVAIVFAPCRLEDTGRFLNVMFNIFLLPIIFFSLLLICFVVLIFVWDVRKKILCKMYPYRKFFGELNQVNLATELMGDRGHFTAPIEGSHIKFLKHPSWKVKMYVATDEDEVIYIAPNMIQAIVAEQPYIIEHQCGYAIDIEEARSW